MDHPCLDAFLFRFRYQCLPCEMSWFQTSPFSSRVCLSHIENYPFNALVSGLLVSGLPWVSRGAHILHTDNLMLPGVSLGCRVLHEDHFPFTYLFLGWHTKLWGHLAFLKKKILMSILHWRECFQGTEHNVLLVGLCVAIRRWRFLVTLSRADTCVSVTCVLTVSRHTLVQQRSRIRPSPAAALVLGFPTLSTF